MLTELQKSRILFHLDIPSQQNDLLSVDREIILSQLSATVELQVIGNLGSALVEDIYVFQGEQLATLESILGRCERAFDALSPATVADSLFVKKAGDVELISREPKLREAFYRQQVKYLAQTIGAIDLGNGRVGF